MRRPLRASHTAKPRPSRPAIISAATTTSHDRPAVTRSAVMTCGAIAGSVTCAQQLEPVDARDRARRGSRRSGCWRRRRVVESTIGKNAAMKIRKIAGGSPMPSQRIANGIHASGDRLRKKLTIGRNAVARAARVPEQQAERHADEHRRAGTRPTPGTATRSRR